MAIVRKAGWEFDQDGKEVFLVIVEYRKEDRQPEFPIDAVWKETPVEVVLSEELRSR